MSENQKSTSSDTVATIIAMALLAIAGWWIANRAMMPGGNSPESIIYHYMLLDAWNLILVAVIVVLWFLRSSPSTKATFLFVAIGLYGVVALVLVFAPSQFPDNGYWGDQKFRIAMIEHFMASGTLSDYYYKGLPIFYPPVYYYALALLGKLADQPGYKMAQVGLGLIFILAPVCIYVLWRKVLTTVPALVVTGAVILLDIGGSFMLVAVPHAFLSNSLFVPWCLHYIMGIGSARQYGWKQWLAGSVVGAVILATYFYPFILLGFGLTIGATIAIIRRDRLKAIIRNWPRALAITLGVGLFSSFYWLPNVVAVLKFGMDRSRGDWYHATSGGLGFPFLEFNWIGIIGLVAIGVALWRWRTQTLRALLCLLAASLALFLIGSVLGALDISINLTKDREFTWALLTPLIGLAFYAFARKAVRRPGGQVAVGGVLAILMLLCVRGMTTLAHDSSIERARSSSVPDFGLTGQSRAKMTNKVLLSSNEECYAFLPAKAFLNINEHYAHPASQFALRYDFLSHLCKISDPALFHYALRHNRFDAVDYILPERKGDSVFLYVALSNYPNGLTLKQLSFPAKYLDDTLLYRRVEKSGIYAVQDTDEDDSAAAAGVTGFVGSIEELSDLLAVRNRLNVEGQATAMLAPGSNDMKTTTCLNPIEPMWFDKELLLIDCNAISWRDTIYIVMTFRKNRPIFEPTRIYLHLYTQPDKAEFENYDFPPLISVDQWKIGDLVMLSRAFPYPGSPTGFVLGVFDLHGPRGRSFNGHLDFNNR